MQYGDTVVFGAVVRANPREGIDFFPLQVDYRERRAAAGKFPGGFMKREGRPTTKEILTARLIDRPLRPLFPKGFMDEVQIHLNVLAFDGENDPDILAGIAASRRRRDQRHPVHHARSRHVRVGRIDGELVLNPTVEQLEYSDFDLVVAGTKHFVNMIEVGGREVDEDDVADAIEFGHKAIVEIVGMIEELQQQGRQGEGRRRQAARAGLRRRDPRPRRRQDPRGQGQARQARPLRRGQADPRRPAHRDGPAGHRPQRAATCRSSRRRTRPRRSARSSREVEEQVTREAILAGVRPDGRGFNDIRPIYVRGRRPARACTARPSSPAARRSRCAPSRSAPAPTSSSSTG